MTGGRAPGSRPGHPRPGGGPPSGPRDDDTELDALAAQAHAHPELSTEAVDSLLTAARDGDTAARAALVEHLLGTVLTAAVAHQGRGVEVGDLFQEGSVAAMVAIEEYVARGGGGAQLAAYVRRVVAGHLDRVVEREEAAAAEASAVVHDVQMLEMAQVALRRRAGREPTEVELAAALDWPPERVELIAGMLAAARQLFDADITQYLDDVTEDDDPAEGDDPE